MKRFILLTLSLCIAHLTFAQDPSALVDNIKFNKLQNDWLEMEVKIRANANTAPDARNERFVDNIKVLGYFAYQNSKTKAFEFYKSEVEIISIEQGQTENVYFYMPGIVAKRDRLPKEPDYYFLALEINGQVLQMDNRAYSSNLNDDTIRSMKTKADAESAKNDFILKPSYNAPLAVINGARPDTKKMATLLIREPKQ